MWWCEWGWQQDGDGLGAPDLAPPSLRRLWNWRVVRRSGRMGALFFCCLTRIVDVFCRAGKRCSRVIRMRKNGLF
jgi:hypothetical protein